MLTIQIRKGGDSEFYRVEQRLTEQGLGRRAHETSQDWLARLESGATLDTSSLVEMAELHNRYRFDPLGLSEAQRALLKDAASTWLALNKTATQP
jgi:hypothetical protein